MGNQLVISLLKLQIAFDNKSAAADTAVAGESIADAQVYGQTAAVVLQDVRQFFLMNSNQLQFTLPEQLYPELPDDGV